MFKYFSFFLLSLFLTMPVFAQAQTQGQQRVDITNEVVSVIEVTEGDLDLSFQDVIPGSPWYGFKEFGRGLSLFFTFNSVKKAEKLSTFSNERLFEIQKLIAQGADQSVIDHAIEQYKKEMEQIKGRIEELAQEGNEKTKQRLQTFLEKFTDHQIRHQELFDRIIAQAPQAVRERLQEVKQEHAKRFFDTLKRVDSKGELMAKGVQRQLQDSENTDLHLLQRMRVLQKMGQEIQNGDVQVQLGPAQAGIFQRLEEKLEQNPDNADRILQFIQQTSDDQIDTIDFVAGLKRASSAKHRALFEQMEQRELQQLEQDVLNNHPRMKAILEDEVKAQYIQQLPLRSEVKARVRAIPSPMQGESMREEKMHDAVPEIPPQNKRLQMQKDPAPHPRAY